MVTDMLDELIEKTAESLASSKYAIVLTGAGVSTESGIPDFRGPSGVWTKNPQAEKDAYKSYPKFIEDPKAWWEDAMASPSNRLADFETMKPNPGHDALARLEEIGVLKCTITQNVDALHERAGSKNLLEYHGNAFKLRCVRCDKRYRREDYDFEKLLREDQLPPRCSDCGGPVKSDVVFFTEAIPSDVAMQSEVEARKCDFMLICGTTATVYPFANLPRIARQDSQATIIEVNAEPTPLTHEGVSAFLIEGKTGEVLPRIAEAVEKKL